MRPQVSICMITYNHSKYIAEAIESIMMQHTNFPYQLVIGEDCSTDNTREICEQYADRFPDKIKLLPSDKNYGVYNNFFRVIEACDGEYVAICDGDDYWTDSNKLQVQADFLNANPGISICSHLLQMVDEDGNEVRDIGDDETNKYFQFRDCIITRPGGTASMFFRRSALDVGKLKDVLHDRSYLIDWPMELLLLDNGNGYYSSQKMGVYRKHTQGITSIAKNNIPIKALNNRLDMVDILKDCVADAHARYLKSFLGILLLKKARISKEARFRNLSMGISYLFRYPYFLLNTSKLSNRYNPFN